MEISREAFGENYSRWDEMMCFACRLSPVPWHWMKLIAMVESALGQNPRVKAGLDHPADTESSKSEDGLSWGLLQLKPSTAKDFDPNASARLLNDPAYTFKIGAALLTRLYKNFKGEEQWVIKAWNQGQGNTEKEKAGLIPGHAANYWNKYQSYKVLI